ncbi:hypothetical protein ABZ478_22610 [Streptomyces sp. NPDC005706]|uniref:hypothetical protein n=1 Tax=Streptomyces sp. NPDC005706 TaxID=3157169 RepID=UPI0033E6AB24
MKASASRPEGLDPIWRTQILPLLEDRLYGTGIDVADEYGFAALGDSLGTEGTTTVDPGRPSTEDA